MLLRLLAAFALAAVLLSAGYSLWRSGAIGDWLAPPAAPPAIAFDNGSARPAPPPPASGAQRVAALSPPGALRKCVRGDRVSYSNLTCPPGFVERPVAQDGVTVVPAYRPAGQAAAVPADQPAAPATAPHQKLRAALDLQRDEQLRQRMIDKAVAAEAR